MTAAPGPVLENDFLYKKLSAEIESKIRNGELRIGDKLPSLRGFQAKLGLAMGTVYQAYLDLEATGLIEARPRSGFFVAAGGLLARSAPRHENRTGRPRPVRLTAIIADVVTASLDPRLVPLGASALSPELLPHKHLGRLIRGLPARETKKILNYAPPEGDPELRRLFATRLFGLLPGVESGELLITNGCMEAVALALNALVRPGQVVAVESPTHFGFLQLLRSLNLYAVAVPTDPGLGLDPSALAQVLKKYDVKACLTIPNFHNPLGALMPDERKAELVRLTNKQGVPVIEDDVYGEMHFGDRRPSLLKSWDRRDLVVTCSSLSKVLAPGFRIGWCLPGRRIGEAVRRLKAAFSLTSPSLSQHILRRFMAQGSFDRYLRSLRKQVKLQITETALAVQRHFPAATRLTVPQGGNLLWIELPSGVDGVELYRQALSAGVSIVPGEAFTVSGGYKNYIRLSATAPLDERIDRGIATLGRLVHESAAKPDINKQIRPGGEVTLS